MQVNVDAISSTQLLVTWRSPERDLWNGEILGYAVGFRRSDEGGGGGDQAYNFSRMGSSGNEGNIHEFRLTGLDKFTSYNVVVLAFNAKGDGPISKAIKAQTLEDSPSSPPLKIACSAMTSHNIQINWLPPPVKHMHGEIQGYKVSYEPTTILNEYTNRETKVTSALSTVIHNLQPFTNYSVQIQAFTKAGEGVSSTPLICRTEESAPDAPEKIKAIVTGETSVIISWLPPRRPNGILTLYTIFTRILNKGQEIKVDKITLPAHNHHYEAKNLNPRETYEAWVTASTKLGSGNFFPFHLRFSQHIQGNFNIKNLGPSTPVVKLHPSSQVPAQIISFGQIVTVAWNVDVKLACLYVGKPKPTLEWIVEDKRAERNRIDIGDDNTLTLRNVRRIHESNYTCVVANQLGIERITYQLYVQVPPGAPKLQGTATSHSSATLHWHLADSGGAPIKNYLLTYRRQFGEWHEITIDRRSNSYTLENLQCGTEYEFTIAAFNKIGSGSVSETLSIKTAGEKPIAPHIEKFLKVNITSVFLELIEWQNGGCSILYFTVEYKRRYANDWIIVSSNVASQARFPIGDLESSTVYSLRVQAHNNAGSTVAEYTFETLNVAGGMLSSLCGLMQILHFLLRVPT